jgi:small-conductance mechanosensitive channel
MLQSLFGIPWIDSVVGFVFDVVAFLVVFVLVYLAGRVVVGPAVKKTLRSRDIDETVVGLAGSVTGAVMLFAALAIGLTVAGFPTFLAAFATLGGALALAVGFAAQDLLGNFVAGVFILKDKPFESGDWIEWNDESGRVEDIDLRVSRVRTFDNERITVPNSELANNAVTNPVAYDKLRQKFVFGIGYDDDIEAAKGAIVDELTDIEDVLEDPAPDTRVTELGDSAVGVQARFWIADPDRSDFMRVRSTAVQHVKERFDAEGIEMPYVFRELTGEIDVTERMAKEPEAEE